MKTSFLLFFILPFTLNAQIVDTIVYLDPNPPYDTATYIDMQFGNARIDNDMYASEFIGQNQVKFVGYSRQELSGFQFIRGTLRDPETGKTGDIFKGGEISEEMNSMLVNANNTIFYLEIEFILPDGEYRRRKSKFLVKKDPEK
ncbi:MAG: hypothetical protein H6582_05565 [Crocinitomicaceae bacterium]|nr:hypothetical protein [Crocinitomicaceae bacterium]